MQRLLFNREFIKQISITEVKLLNKQDYSILNNPLTSTSPNISCEKNPMAKMNHLVCGIEAKATWDATEGTNWAILDTSVCKITTNY